MAERLALIEAEAGLRPSAVTLSEAAGAGLLDAGGSGAIVLAVEAVRATRGVHDLDFLLRIKLAARIAREPAHVSKRARFLSGLAGLYASEAVSNRERLDRNRPLPYTPPSALDNAPVPVDPDRLAEQLKLALVRTACERQSIDLLRRLAAGRGAEDKTARDAREVLRILGALAYHPATACSPDPSDAAYARAVAEIG